MKTTIITDYYKFERVAIKAKHRMDCTISTHSYPEFEEKASTKARKCTDKSDAINVGDIIIYYNDVPDKFKGDVHRKADKSITLKGKNLSSIYIPDLTMEIGYGDVKNTNDALLFVFHNLKLIDGVIQKDSVIEVFIARGRGKDRVALFNLFSEGELEDEINELRKKATPTHICSLRGY